MNIFNLTLCFSFLVVFVFGFVVVVIYYMLACAVLLCGCCMLYQHHKITRPAKCVVSNVCLIAIIVRPCAATIWRIWTVTMKLRMESFVICVAAYYRNKILCFFNTKINHDFLINFMCLIFIKTIMNHHNDHWSSKFCNFFSTFSDWFENKTNSKLKKIPNWIPHIMAVFWWYIAALMMCVSTLALIHQSNHETLFDKIKYPHEMVNEYGTVRTCKWWGITWIVD